MLTPTLTRSGKYLVLAIRDLKHILGKTMLHVSAALDAFRPELSLSYFSTELRVWRGFAFRIAPPLAYFLERDSNSWFMPRVYQS